MLLFLIFRFVGVVVAGVVVGGGVDQDFWLSKRRSSQSGRSKTSNDKNSYELVWLWTKSFKITN